MAECATRDVRRYPTDVPAVNLAQGAGMPDSGRGMPRPWDELTLQRFAQFITHIGQHRFHDTWVTGNDVT